MIHWIVTLIILAAVIKMWLKVFPLKPSQQVELDTDLEKIRMVAEKVTERAIEAFRREEARK